MSSDSKELAENNSCESMSVTQSSVESTSQNESCDILWMNIVISTEKEWDIIYKKVKRESLFLNLTISHHYDAWWKLITSVDEKPDKENIVLHCIKEMIETMPVSTLDDTLWCRYVEGAYILKQKGTLSDDGFNTYLKCLEEKLLLSYTKPGIYWQTVRTCEKKYHQHEDEDKLYIEKCLDTFKKQFSTPYVDINTDAKKLKNFAKKSNMRVNLNDFFSSEDMEKMMNEANAYMNCFETSSKNNHHVLFEEYIAGLLEQDPPQVKRALVLCEETICDEMYSACYHFVLAKTLCSTQMKEAFEASVINEKLFKAFKRGIHLGREGCDDMLFYYLDYALNAVAKYFDQDQAREIFYDIVEKIKFDDSVEQYFASRKALIFGLKTLIENNKMKITEFQNKIDEIIEPLTYHFFNGDGIFKESSALPDFELKCIELKKLVLQCQKELMNTPWKETLAIWKRGLSSLTDPHSLVEFATFVRENGPSSDVEAAYVRAIELVEKLNNSPNCSYSTRRCLFLLHKHLREFVAVHGGQTDNMKFLEKLTKVQSKSSADHNESYYLSHHTQIYDDHIAYYASISSTNPLNHGSVHYQAEPSEIPVTQMQKLTVDPYEEENKEGYPIFLSNLNFKASKSDIVEAFKVKGLNVVRIKMGINPKTHNNFGFARVEFGSKKEAAQALQEHDRIQIAGRPTFVSVCKEKETNNDRSKKESTILLISGLPEDWRNHDKINDLLSPFGHIKSTELEEETGFMKVDYYMAGDAFIGAVKLQEKFGKKIKVRRGYASQKDGLTQQKTLKPRTGKTNSNQLPDILKLDKQAVRKPIMARPLIPLQLRQQMKKKLDLMKPGPGGDMVDSLDVMPETQEVTMESPDSKSSQDSSPPEKRMKITSRTSPDSKSSQDSSPPEKRMKITSRTSDGGKLTNADFRKMLNK